MFHFKPLTPTHPGGAVLGDTWREGGREEEGIRVRELEGGRREGGEREAEGLIGRSKGAGIREEAGRKGGERERM